MEKKLVKPSKARVALFLAKRPAYYPDLIRRLKYNIAGRLVPAPMGRGRAAARAWANATAISEDEAFARLGVRSGPGLTDAHADEWAAAERREEECPVAMGGGGGADLIFRLCEALEARVVVETGVAHGFSSLALLLSVAKRDGHVYSVDMPHPLLGDPALTGIVVPDHLRARWTLYQLPDSVGLDRILNAAGPVDFCHYDSDKSYEGRALSYPKMWKALRPGGVLMSDDINDNTGFRDFAAELDIEPIVVLAEGSGTAGARHVGLLVKPTS